MVANQTGNVRIVFNHEDAWFHRDYCSERSCEYLVPSAG
jgi:hypothetical protein